MEKPAEVFARDAEWDALTAFAMDDRPGARLALVRGRRRQGKSYLLRRLAQMTGGFYYQALEQERTQSLDSFGRALGTHLEVPGGRLPADDWDQVVQALADLSAERSRVVIIDEFPYLLAHSPELPSLLQRFIDESQDSHVGIRLILCGSALSVMAQLLEGTQALRGRASTDVIVSAFDYRTAASFWDIADPVAALLVHAVVGGTPGYRDLLPEATPATAEDFFGWLEAGPLNPASALFREDDYLLTEERTLTDRRLYHAIIAALAEGNTSQSKIAQALGRDAGGVQHALRSLREVGFVVAADDALRARRPVYRLADPIVRFHQAVTRRDIARFEDRQTQSAWVDAQHRFRTHVLGPHFEDVVSEFTRRFAAPATTGGTVMSVAPAVINDSKARQRHELDIVATSRSDSGAEHVIALGEAKHTSALRTPTDLRRLEHVRDLVAVRRPEAASAKLLLASANGFDKALRQEAQTRNDVELIDAERLYFGE